MWTAAVVIFCVCLGIILYTYFGYAALITLLNAFKRKRNLPGALPGGGVTVVIPAYNELRVLPEKLANTLAAIEGIADARILLITDGSNDGSESLQPDDPRITHLHQPERRGKSASINRAMEYVQTEFVVLTDANAMINPEAIRRILMHYHQPDVGGVSGEKRVQTGGPTGGTGGEGLYWKYESFLKLQGARFYTIVGAAGELFSFRKNLFESLPEDTILDDFVLSVRMVRRKFRIAYAPDAYAMEPPSKTIQEEFERKVRISSGVWQTLGRTAFLFNPFANFRLHFQFISHRFLRWTLAPLSLVLLFGVNLLLLDEPVFLVFFVLQCFFYFSALLGFLLKNRKVNLPLVFVPFYYCMMNLAVAGGLVRYLRGGHSVLWNKAER